MKKIIEAESFLNLGGWLIETQSMAEMGSAYIMAHGMGVPVPDAETEVLMEEGVYHFYVRTRDWTACWGRGNPAGRFTLKVNGEALPTVLGTNGENWQWQYAGAAMVPAGRMHLALHDLTGFNGRCDAVYISDSPEEPCQDNEKLATFRREVCGITVEDCPETYDLIVAGGGVAGVCTALSAIRSGVKTLLIQDRGVLGGCNSSEVRVSLGGIPHAGPYPKLGNVVEEIGPVMGSGGTYRAEYYEDARKLHAFEKSDRSLWKVLLHTAVVDVEREGNTIVAVITRSCKTGKEVRYRARLFADCTGDGFLARKMGATTLYGTEGEADFGESLAPKEASSQVMGQSVLWLSSDTGMYAPFPEVDFGIEMNDERVLYVKNGDWEWESGQYRNQAHDAEHIRDYAMMAIYANWSYLKHHSKWKEEFRNRKLDWVSPIGGKRESYRVVGDHILTQQDMEEQRMYPDGTAVITWDIDIHYPDPKFTDKYPEPFRSCAYHRGIGHPYPIPYRCLYAKDVDNLFLGGRIISTTHVAFAAVRVMRTLGQLGEVIGMAAAVCKEFDTLPRGVYTEHLDALMERMERGIDVPWYHGWMPCYVQKYHFKEIGQIVVPDEYERICADKELYDRVCALDVIHLDGKRMKDIGRKD